MLPPHQSNENSCVSPSSAGSDSNYSKLQLLLLASELSYRRMIGTDCPSEQQFEQRRKWLFDDAQDLLASRGRNLKPHEHREVNRALNLAYDLFGATNENQDMAFHQVSYGGCDDDEYLYCRHH